MGLKITLESLSLSILKTLTENVDGIFVQFYFQLWNYLRKLDALFSNSVSDGVSWDNWLDYGILYPGMRENEIVLIFHEANRNPCKFLGEFCFDWL